MGDNHLVVSGDLGDRHDGPPDVVVLGAGIGTLAAGQQGVATQRDDHPHTYCIGSGPGMIKAAVGRGRNGMPVNLIDQVIPRWHAFLQSGGAAELGELLAEDVVFYSPVVFTPQRGKEVTTMYLMAAKQVLGGEGPEGQFHYAKQVLAGDTAVLEFETSLAGKYVNGVDIIRCDETGKIVEFRVMIRPLQAINALHESMRAMLESLQR